MRKLVLIDSNALVHRAFHALPPTLTSPKGIMTNAVYGFTSVLLKMLKDLKPDYIAATYDLAGPTFRHEEFEEYKAHREKAPDELYAQIPLTKDILGSFGIPIYEKQGFEADDLIGALAEKAKRSPPAGGLQVVIVTGDMDTLQLVDEDKVVVFTLRKGLTDTVIYNEEEVKKRYGIKPEQVVDFKGLKGDPSDNIPGVPGIGEKTASILIQEYGSIEEMYEQIAKRKTQNARFAKASARRVKSKKGDVLTEKLLEKLVENKDQAFFSKKLATIVRDVDIDFNLEKTDWHKNMDRQKIENLFREFGFYSLIRRLDELDIQVPILFPTKSELQNRGSSIFGTEIGTTEDRSSLKELRTKNDISRALTRLGELKEITFDIVRDGLFIWIEGEKDFFSFDLGDLTVKKSGSDELWKAFVSIFENPAILKTGHDLKPALKKFLGYGIHAKGLSFDTKIAAYLIKADRKDYDLAEMYRNEFGEDLASREGARLDAIVRLKKLFWEKLKSDVLLRVFEDIEMPLIPVLAEMESIGIKIDIASLKKLNLSVSKEITDLEKQIYGYAGIQFNINSPKQMKEILFERLSLKGKVRNASSPPKLRRTSKGAISTAASELDKLSGEHPIIDLILKYRELQKLKTTYIEPFPQLVNQKTGRLYTTFNQTGTVTGRLSSQNPNLQNVPIKTEIGQEFRKAFISSPGFKLVSFDYSQLELRIAAHISQDAKMTAAFKGGEDIHTRTAAEIFGVSAKDITKDMRRQAKAMNFGLLYGMGVMGFQRASGVSRDRAREFIDRYMREFSGIACYMDQMKEKARKSGFVSTIFGRRRYLPEINSGLPQLVAQAERMAINMPIQGTEGDFLRIAMNRIYDLIHEKYNDNDIKMLLQVHDELLFEIKNSLIQEVAKVIRNIMESVHQLDVPLIVDVRYGDNWRDLESI